MSPFPCEGEVAVKPGDGEEGEAGEAGACEKKKVSLFFFLKRESR